MNSAWKYKTPNQYLAKLDQDFKAVQKLIWNTLQDKMELPSTIIARKDGFKQNKEGRYLNIILTHYENKLLQTVMNNEQFKGKVATPMFDGFTYDTEKNMMTQEEGDQMIADLNNITSPLGVKWSFKDHDTSIVKDEGIEISILFKRKVQRFGKTNQVLEPRKLKRL